MIIFIIIEDYSGKYYSTAPWIDQRPTDCSMAHGLLNGPTDCSTTH